MVPLTAQQIVQTDPEKRYVPAYYLFALLAHCLWVSRIWENRVLETLDHRPNKKSSYVLLRSEQVSMRYLLFSLLMTLACWHGTPCPC
jgi:hypothetical protein